MHSVHADHVHWMQRISSCAYGCCTLCTPVPYPDILFSAIIIASSAFKINDRIVIYMELLFCISWFVRFGMRRAGEESLTMMQRLLLMAHSNSVLFILFFWPCKLKNSIRTFQLQIGSIFQSIPPNSLGCKLRNQLLTINNFKHSYAKFVYIRMICVIPCVFNAKAYAMGSLCATDMQREPLTNFIHLCENCWTFHPHYHRKYYRTINV